jgi:formate hydrogenlyase transcriptional activator
LSNLIERAVILSRGPVLEVPLVSLGEHARASAGADTLEGAERRHVLSALGDSKWILAGPNGAAARLGTKRSTLQFRMRKLGIEPLPGKFLEN